MISSRRVKLTGLHCLKNDMQNFCLTVLVSSSDTLTRQLKVLLEVPLTNKRTNEQNYERSSILMDLEKDTYGNKPLYSAIALLSNHLFPYLSTFNNGRWRRKRQRKRRRRRRRIRELWLEPRRIQFCRVLHSLSNN